jgi:hypothetical protein
MPGRIAHAEKLIDHARKAFGQMKLIHVNALAERQDSDELQIDIKNLLENLRSALDFTARALYEKVAPSGGTAAKV